MWNKDMRSDDDGLIEGWGKEAEDEEEEEEEEHMLIRLFTYSSLVLGTFGTHVDSELYGEYGIFVPHDPVEGKSSPPRHGRERERCSAQQHERRR